MPTVYKIKKLSSDPTPEIDKGVVLDNPLYKVGHPPPCKEDEELVLGAFKKVPKKKNGRTIWILEHVPRTCKKKQH